MPAGAAVVRVRVDVDLASIHWIVIAVAESGEAIEEADRVVADRR